MRWGLPMIANGTMGAGSGQSAAARYDLSALEVMVVDDSPYMLKLVRLILRSMNVGQVHCHDQPQHALSAMEQQPPDLLITDLLMAPLDGLELTRSVRRHGSDALRFTPIFVLSGYTHTALQAATQHYFISITTHTHRGARLRGP